jgi:hypothetical protein
VRVCAQGVRTANPGELVILHDNLRAKVAAIRKSTTPGTKAQWSAVHGKAFRFFTSLCVRPRSSRPMQGDS